MELLVNGKFNKEELRQLEQELQKYDVRVHRYFTKDIEIEEIVRLIFRDFDALTALRDDILVNILWEITKKTIQWVRNKKPNTEIQTSSQVEFKRTDKKAVCVNLGIPSAKNQKFWKQLKSILTVEFVNGIKKGETVSITWDEGKKKIKILRF